MGPAGGDGGNGGDVYVRAVGDLNLLAHYRHKKEFLAERGEDGAKRSMHGKNGEDLYINLPVGSIITNMSPIAEDNTTSAEIKISLEKVGEEKLILKGGRGGFGNEHFKASTNVKPMECTLGRESEKADFHIEIELIAAAGLIGLPNAGKSSLLNSLTNAQAKIGSYQFTTLEPNLGALQEFVIADIPGLIEGASEGKGLGHKFLKHIRRTRALLHCISLENENLGEVYKTVRDELEKFDPTLADKKEIIILTKTDTLSDPKEIKAKIKELPKALQKDCLSVSILDDKEIKALIDELVKILRNDKLDLE